MKCKHCGAEIANDSVFCEYCGEKQRYFDGKIKWVIPLLIFIIVIFGGLIAFIPKNNVLEENLIEVEDSIINDYSFDEEIEGQEEAIEVVFSQKDAFYCDGVYDYDHGDKELGHGLSIAVPKLNREHFQIQFSFMPTTYKGKLKWTDVQYPLVLGHSSRCLAICLDSDKNIYFTTNNHRNVYKTNLSYEINKYNTIELEYKDGVISINGERWNVNINFPEDDSDLIFTSKCYATGNAFKGYIKDLDIYNVY